MAILGIVILPVQRSKHVGNSASLLTHTSSSHAKRATWIDSMSCLATILLILTLGITLANAGDRKWPPIKGDKSCREATDGCQVCKFGSSGKLIGCSTPGIACQPGGWSCSALHSGTATAASDKPKVNIVGYWRAISLQGWPVQDQRVVYLEFSKGGLLRASTGCNSMGGKYTINATKVTLSNFTSTLKLCHGEVMTAESKLKDTLIPEFTISVKGEELRILDTNGKERGLFRRGPKSSTGE